MNIERMAVAFTRRTEAIGHYRVDGVAVVAFAPFVEYARSPARAYVALDGGVVRVDERALDGVTQAHLMADAALADLDDQRLTWPTGEHEECSTRQADWKVSSGMDGRHLLAVDGRHAIAVSSWNGAHKALYVDTDGPAHVFDLIGGHQGCRHCGRTDCARPSNEVRRIIRMAEELG